VFPLYLGCEIGKRVYNSTIQSEIVIRLVKEALLGSDCGWEDLPSIDKLISGVNGYYITNHSIVQLI